MGTHERRERERKAVKESIIAAAKDIAIKEGWDAVTVRKIAEKIDYTPPIIYQYFKDKSELLRELKREGLQKLLAKYQSVLRSSQNAPEALTNLATAYWDFAWENPELYKLMYGLYGIELGVKGLEEEIAQIRVTIRDTLARVLQESGSSYQKDVDWEEAIDILRSLLHGVIAFSMSNGLRGGKERASTLAMKGVKDLVTFWIVK